MGSIDANACRPGTKLLHDGELYTVLERAHHKPGKGGAFVRFKLKGIVSGKVIDHTVRAGTKMETADVTVQTMQYLYQDGESLVFMDTTSFEQLPLSIEQVGDARKFLKESLEVDVLFWRGRPLNVELPSFITAVITRCEPGIKGDTASNVTKPATLETGAIVQVPLFVKEGEVIRVDTRSGEYVERVG